jgi:hypothetical protein
MPAARDAHSPSELLAGRGVDDRDTWLISGALAWHDARAQVGIMDTLDLRDAPARAPVLEASLTLSEPQSHLRVRLPSGTAGRAEAVMGKKSWAAKHYWQEQGEIMVYEFDEPLPAGQITLRIPLGR